MAETSIGISSIDRNHKNGAHPKLLFRLSSQYANIPIGLTPNKQLTSQSTVGTPEIFLLKTCPNISRAFPQDVVQSSSSRRLLRASSTFSSRRHLPSRFLLEFSSVLSAAPRSGFSSRFSSGFSPRPSHGSRDLNSRTGVADAKKLHRELTAIAKGTGGEGGARGDNRRSTNEEHDATLIEATARKRGSPTASSAAPAKRKII
ncbi:hypothetical protein EAG_14770 [Camponotus floridanus]|uniref:Uncharacterized protein n=1 Tax=Camponotus floridanus TaxID=104421 RepID=E2A560_CAMFO|nr:hypothetical protein EAG_14770 [Camponotus floridanus]